MIGRQGPFPRLPKEENCCQHRQQEDSGQRAPQQRPIRKALSTARWNAGRPGQAGERAQIKEQISSGLKAIFRPFL